MTTRKNSRQKVEADRLLNLGKEHYQKSRFREALASWQQALTIYQEIRDRQGEANSLGNLGNAYHSLGQYQLAIDNELITKLLTCEEGEEFDILLENVELLDRGSVERIQVSAKILAQQGDTEWANKLRDIIKVLFDSDETENSPQKVEAERLFNLGKEHYQKSRFREALASWQQALTIYQEIRDRHGEAASLGNLGVAYHSLGQFQLAIDYHLQLLEIAREIGDRQGEANSLGNLGSAYESLGQYQLAIDYHQQYLEIAREIPDRQGEANSLGNLGNAYQSLGQYQLAIDYYQQQLAIAREIRDRHGESISLNNLGETLKKINQFPDLVDTFHSFPSSQFQFWFSSCTYLIRYVS